MSQKAQIVQEKVLEDGTPGTSKGGIHSLLLLKGAADSKIDFVLATLAVFVTLFVALFLEGSLGLGNLSLVFLIGIFFTAARSGLLPSFYAVGLSFIAYNFFFTEPRYTLFVYHRSDLVTLVLYLIVASVTGSLAVRLREQRKVAELAAKRSAVLHDMSHNLANAVGVEEIASEAAKCISSYLNRPIAVILRNQDAKEGLTLGATSSEDVKPSDFPWKLAERVFDSGVADRFIPSGWEMLPLSASSRTVGILAIQHGANFERNSGLPVEKDQITLAFCNQLALALERGLLARELEEKRVENESEQLRSALLSSISHDLRTPLSSIIGSATTLSEMSHALTESNREELVGNILGEAERLNSFVQNLLDMTRLGRGTVKLRCEWIEDLRELIGRATGRLKGVIRSHEIKLDFDDSLSAVLLDQILFEQVLVNILENAIKYSPEGSSITFTLRASDSGVDLRVIDEGSGVPSEDREKIFDMFYRVRAKDSKVAGTGLGLAICKAIVEAHGGNIHAEEGAGGRGTAIVIALPKENCRFKSATEDPKAALPEQAFNE